MEKEIWKSVVGSDGYYLVSSFGEIKNKYGHTMRISIDKKGYATINLSKATGVSRYVHRVVAQNFIPNPENKLQVNHKDGNKKNNKISNLEWATPKENIDHSYGLITARIGQRHSQAYLTDAQARQIYHLGNNTKLKPKEIGDMFGFSHKIVGKIINKRSYKRITQN
jgi:hypothetical protein